MGGGRVQVRVWSLASLDTGELKIKSGHDESCRCVRWADTRDGTMYADVHVVVQGISKRDTAGDSVR